MVDCLQVVDGDITTLLVGEVSSPEEVAVEMESMILYLIEILPVSKP